MPTLDWLTRREDEQAAGRVPYRGVELGEHAVTHCVPRLRKVIDGEQSGISAAVGCQERRPWAGPDRGEARPAWPRYLRAVAGEGWAYLGCSTRSSSTMNE